MMRLIGALVACAVMVGSARAEPAKETETRSESLHKDALALLAIGGITLAGSAGLAFAAKDISDEISSHDPSQPWDYGTFHLAREGERLANLSTITGVLGVGFLATSALCYWRSRVAAREEASITVSPITTPSSAGVALSGSF